MTGLRPLALIAALMLAMLAPSCRLFRKSPKATAPPPAPAPTQPARKPAPKPGEEQVALPAPPQISPQHPDLTQQPPGQTPAAKLPPRPRNRHGSRATKAHETQEAPAAQQQPAAQPPAAEEPAAEVPQLEQILTPEQRQAYLEEIDNNVGRAQKTVDTLHGRRLNRDQKIYLSRVRAFIDQAKEARDTDLFRAKNLSERASVLAEDLLRSVQ